jgi:phosphoribosylformylglycinamidine synthase subunit PurS
MKAIVKIKLKNSILDPQGKAVNNALHHLGYDEIEDVRIGKLIELRINGNDLNNIRERIQEASNKLLVNPVIEDYEIEIVED